MYLMFASGRKLDIKQPFPLEIRLLKTSKGNQQKKSKVKSTKDIVILYYNRFFNYMGFTYLKHNRKCSK